MSALGQETSPFGLMLQMELARELHNFPSGINKVLYLSIKRASAGIINIAVRGDGIDKLHSATSDKLWPRGTRMSTLNLIMKLEQD